MKIRNDIGLFFFRVVLSAMMLTHGISKMKILMEGKASGFSDPIGLGPVLSLILVIFAELLCSLLIIAGLKTRLATIPLIINMFVAAFIVHGDDPFSNKELALLYLLGFVCITILGPGKYSVDYLIRGKRE